MNDFFPKIGRSTKGGSLPSNVGERGLTDVFRRGLSRSELPAPASRDNAPNNGSADQTLHLNGNGMRGSAPNNGSADQTLSLNGNGMRGSALSARASDLGTYPRATAASVAPFEVPRWKRILDVTCILLTLPCWLPLMILIMVLIRFASRGPVFYRQERVGYRRNRFMIFKFRTMHVGAETKTHEEYFAHLMRVDRPMAKLDGKGDLRLIACGRLLRASGLDELPQIFNVLRGEMSLVGPRPCLPHEFERYEPWQRKRVYALPGLTGYWQVNGKNKTTFKEMIAMDVFYSRNMSIWLDLSIILKTVPVLIGQALESCTKLSRDSRPANYF